MADVETPTEVDRLAELERKQAEQAAELERLRAADPVKKAEARLMRSPTPTSPWVQQGFARQEAARLARARAAEAQAEEAVMWARVHAPEIAKHERTLAELDGRTAQARETCETADRDLAELERERFRLAADAPRFVPPSTDGLSRRWATTTKPAAGSGDLVEGSDEQSDRHPRVRGTNERQDRALRRRVGNHLAGCVRPLNQRPDGGRDVQSEPWRGRERLAARANHGGKLEVVGSSDGARDRPVDGSPSRRTRPRRDVARAEADVGSTQRRSERCLPCSEGRPILGALRQSLDANDQCRQHGVGRRDRGDTRRLQSATFGARAAAQRFEDPPSEPRLYIGREKGIPDHARTSEGVAPMTSMEQRKRLAAQLGNHVRGTAGGRLRMAGPLPVCEECGGPLPCECARAETAPAVQRAKRRMPRVDSTSIARAEYELLMAREGA